MQEHERELLKKQFVEKIYNPIKTGWRNRQNKQKTAKLESMFNETDEPAVELDKVRSEFLTHVAEVGEGRGGPSRVDADLKTFELIDKVGEAFRAVAVDIASTKKPVSDYEPMALKSILEADDSIRREKLKKIIANGGMLVYAPQDALRNIAYSFADPQLDSVTDPQVEQNIQIMTHDDAIELYKDIISLQTSVVMERRKPNVGEHGGPHDKLKKTALSVGVIAVAGLILSTGKKPSRHL